MSDYTKIILLFDESLPETARGELGDLLESSGWVAASDNDTCFVCRARADDLDKIEQRARKSIEFAAFSAGLTGRFPFVMQVGDNEPYALSARVGGLKTGPVKRNSGLNFATERVPNRPPQLPKELRSPSVTQLKTAF
jgi:hypothetical protein